MALRTSLMKILCSSNRLLWNPSNFFESPSKHFILLHLRIHCVNSSNSFNSFNRLAENSLIRNSLQLRKKSSGNERFHKYESEENSDDEIATQIPGSKVIQVSSNSLRCDAVLKLGLGISRNKLDLLFYEGRIRVNGKKVPKKSLNVSTGDEVDIIKEFSSENPNFIQISRVEVLKARPAGDLILLTLRKQKSFIIENYSENPWEGDSSLGPIGGKLS